MKKLISLLLIAATLTACTTNHAPVPEKTSNTSTPSERPQGDEVRLIVIADRSVSFVRKYAHPDPELFKPLVDKISANSTIDFRYGCVFDNSDVEFSRFYQLYVKPVIASKKSANPWLSSESKPKDTPQDFKWYDFASQVQKQLSLTPSGSSDISSAINHALTSFQEESKGNTRKILLVCTDFQDSYKNIPPMPSGIEVISVGVLPDAPIEQILHTSIKRFENLDAAIEYLSSTF